MRVLVLSEAGPLGGAGIAAGRLVEGLVAQGDHVTWVTGEPFDGQEFWNARPLMPEYAGSFPFRLVRRLLPSASVARWDAGWSEHWLRELLGELKPDVINVHNIHGVQWPVSLIETCVRCAPTVWTLHDMWSFSGRCVYSGKCEQFLSGCQASCPTADQYPALAPERIEAAWIERQRVLQAARRQTRCGYAFTMAEIPSIGGSLATLQRGIDSERPPTLGILAG